MHTSLPFRPTQLLLPPASLSGAHRHTFEEIFKYPNSHNLTWSAVFALLDELGDVSVESNGHMKIVHHGFLLVLPTPTTDEITSFDDLLQLRLFLQKAEAPPAAYEPAVTEVHEERHLSMAQRHAKHHH